jgi:glycosyltransferase involved in cell wall biosynthesis
MMRVCAIVPAFNEAPRIAGVVRDVRPLVAELVVVDDGSSDGTADVAMAAGARVLRQSTNGGKGTAVRAGLAHALANPFTHVLLLDGDGQHRPADVPRLLAAAGDHDVVLGARVFERDAMPRSRYYANVIGSRALSGFLGVPVDDTQSGFRLFRADTLRGIRLTARGYEIETEMLIRVAQRGARIVSVPVEAVYAGVESKLRPVRDTTRTCFLAVYYRYLSRP